MEPPLLIGLVCWLAAGLVYFIGYRRAAQRYDIIFEVPTVATHDIPGLGASMVEVKGTVGCTLPVSSDLARLPCVAFSCSVTEHWTTTRVERDSKGNTRTVTDHHSETRYSNAVRVPFDVHDDTGCVRVEPEGAAIDMLDSMDGLDEPSPESPAYGISPHHFGGSLRYTEEALPLEQQVYVLAQVGPDNQLLQPKDCDRPYIISYRTEQSLLNRARWGKRIHGVLMVLLFAGGVVGIVMDTGSGF